MARDATGAQTVRPWFPQGYSAAFSRQTLLFGHEADRHSSLERLRVWPPPEAESVDADLAALLPVPRDPVFDHDRNLQWEIDPGSEEADFETATISFGVPEQSVDIASWTMIVPPGTTHVSLPEVPHELQIYWHPASYSSSYEIQVFDVDLWSGFRDARAQGACPWRPEVVLHATPHVMRTSYSIGR